MPALLRTELDLLDIDRDRARNLDRTSAEVALAIMRILADTDATDPDLDDLELRALIDTLRFNAIETLAEIDSDQ